MDSIARWPVRAELTARSVLAARDSHADDSVFSDDVQTAIPFRTNAVFQPRHYGGRGHLPLRRIAVMSPISEREAVQ